MEEDTYSLQLFTCQYHRCMLAASFSKNMGLYGERTGMLSLITTDKVEKEMMQTRLKDTVLPYWSNPPIHGAKIFETINSDPKLQGEWFEEVRGMARRLRGLRE